MIKWTPKAEQDLLQIAKHILKNHDLELAHKKIAEITNHVESLLSNNPLSGHLLQSNPLFSKLVFEGNSIYYCENPRDRDIYVIYVQPRRTKFEKNRLNTKLF